jgi:hypothetical protein
MISDKIGPKLLLDRSLVICHITGFKSAYEIATLLIHFKQKTTLPNGTVSFTRFG